MSFPTLPKNKDYFSENSKLYRYNQKFNAWLLVNDVDSEINKVSDYSQHTKETDFLKGNFYEFDVVDHLANVSELSIETDDKGVPVGNYAIFVYEMDSISPYISYFKGENDGVKIIDGNLQIRKASINKIRVFFMENAPSGFGFYINVNKQNNEYKEYLSIIAQDGNSIDVYDEEFLNINNYTSVLKDGDNFIYIYSDDFQNIKAVINGEDKGIIEETEFFFPVDFAYSNADDFYITTKAYANYPYILYEAKDVTLINYCDKEIEKSTASSPTTIYTESIVNLDEYSIDKEPGARVEIIGTSENNIVVRYTHKSGDIQEEEIKPFTCVPYIWDGNYWNANMFDVGSIVWGRENPQFYSGGEWRMGVDGLSETLAWERIK